MQPNHKEFKDFVTYMGSEYSNLVEEAVYRRDTEMGKKPYKKN